MSGTTSNASTKEYVGGRGGWEGQVLQRGEGTKELKAVRQQECKSEQRRDDELPACSVLSLLQSALSLCLCLSLSTRAGCRAVHL